MDAQLNIVVAETLYGALGLPPDKTLVQVICDELVALGKTNAHALDQKYLKDCYLRLEAWFAQ